MQRRIGARTYALVPIGLFFVVWAATTSLFAPLEALVSALSFFLGTSALVGIAAVRRSGGVVRRADGSGAPAPVAIIGLSTLSAACATIGMFGLSMSAVGFGRGASPLEMSPFLAAFLVSSVVDSAIVGRMGYGLGWVRAFQIAAIHAAVPFVMVGFVPAGPSMLALLGVCVVATCWRDMRPEHVTPKPRTPR